ASAAFSSLLSLVISSTFPDVEKMSPDITFHSERKLRLDRPKNSKMNSVLQRSPLYAFYFRKYIQFQCNNSSLELSDSYRFFQKNNESHRSFFFSVDPLLNDKNID